MESIAGAGGVHYYPVRYMQGIREICNKNDILLILDEVMVGLGNFISIIYTGRTGKWFGF